MRVDDDADVDEDVGGDGSEAANELIVFQNDYVNNNNDDYDDNDGTENNGGLADLVDTVIDS